MGPKSAVLQPVRQEKPWGLYGKKKKYNCVLQGCSQASQEAVKVFIVFGEEYTENSFVCNHISFFLTSFEIELSK